jgi:hypothetical protein
VAVRIGPSDSREIPQAPKAFDGTLEDLYRLHIEALLPGLDVVRRFHALLVEYLDLPDPLFVVRMVAGLERGQDIQVPGGRMRPSDNSPAWMVHRLLFDRLQFADVAHFATTLATAVPCHFHQVARFRTVSTAGWHVAHIFPTKDGNVRYEEWSRAELTRRFVRNLHPCNCFYVPKVDWLRYGRDVDVLAFAAGVYRGRYQPIWSEFLQLAGAHDLPPLAVPASEFRVSIRLRSPTRWSVQAAAHSGAAVVEYAAPRLLFRRAVIETLAPQQRFRIVTRDHGTFEFSREEFERVFDKHLGHGELAARWRLPHAPSTGEALPFRVS